MATNRLDLFAAAYDAAGDGFSRAARATAEVSGVALAAEALIAALAPFDAVCARYGELEAKTLAERVPRVEVTRADDVELAAAEMAATTARAAETLAEPLDRCVALTAGTEAAAMLGAVDDALAKYATSPRRDATRAEGEGNARGRRRRGRGVHDGGGFRDVARGRGEHSGGAQTRIRRCRADVRVRNPRARVRPCSARTSRRVGPGAASGGAPRRRQPRAASGTRVGRSAHTRARRRARRSRPRAATQSAPRPRGA